MNTLPTTGPFVPDSFLVLQLIELILGTKNTTAASLAAQNICHRILGEASYDNPVPFQTNGVFRLIPRDEPVFLIRGQDICAAEAVQAWVQIAKAKGVNEATLRSAKAIAAKMEEWKPKKKPDLPIEVNAVNLEKLRKSILRRATDKLANSFSQRYDGLYHTPQHGKDVGVLAAHLVETHWNDLIHDQEALHRDFKDTPDLKEAMFIAELAGIFHDYGHLLGLQEGDEENIKKAVDGFISFWNNLTGEELKAFDGCRLPTIIEAIMRTEYPKQKYPANNAVYKAVQDADLLAAVFYGRVHDVLNGLRTEINIHNRLKGLKDTATPAAMVESQKNFKPTFFTKFAQETFDALNPVFICQMEMMLKREE